MDESSEMYEELNKWVLFLQRLQQLAIEMESREQDIDFINGEVAKLIDEEPDDDYTLTFHDHRSPKEFRLNIEWEQING